MTEETRITRKFQLVCQSCSSTDVEIKNDTDRVSVNVQFVCRECKNFVTVVNFETAYES